MKLELPLVVGESYKMSNAKKDTVASIDGTGKYPIRMQSGRTLTLEGKDESNPFSKSIDIVRVWDDETTTEVRL